MKLETKSYELASTSNKNEKFCEAHIKEFISQYPILKTSSYSDYLMENQQLIEVLVAGLQANSAKQASAITKALIDTAKHGFEIVLWNHFFKTQQGEIAKFPLLKSFLKESERKQLFMDLASIAIKSTNKNLAELLINHLFPDLLIDSADNRDYKFIEEFTSKNKAELLTCCDENFDMVIKYLKKIPISYSDLSSLANNGKTDRANLLMTKLDDENKNEILVKAVKCGDLTCLSLLISTNLYSQDTIIKTILKHADRTVFERIVDNKLLGPEYSLTPLLHAAFEYNNLNIIKSLIEKYGVNINLLNQEGYTLLHLTCLKPTSEVLKTVFTYLIDKGANVNILGPKNQSALHMICGGPHDKTFIITQATALLLAGADVDCTDKEENTPLGIAINNSNLELIKLLEKYLVNPNKYDPEKMLGVDDLQIVKEIEKYQSQYDLRKEIFALAQEMKQIKSENLLLRQEVQKLAYKLQGEASAKTNDVKLDFKTETDNNNIKSKFLFG